jgi:hypothetical protein
MEGLAHYRQIIQDILLPMENWKHDSPSIKLVAVFDEQRDRYLLARRGWQNGENVYSLVIHIEIEQGKVHLYRDYTDEEIYEQLLERGVPEHDIVQAWLSPAER